MTRLFEHDETLLIAGLGFGKAVVGLTAIQELLNCSHVSRVLVAAPLKVVELTWKTEPAKWSHLTEPVAFAIGTPAQRKAALDSTARIVVTNLDNVPWVMTVAGNAFDGILIDEMSKLKSASSVVVKALRNKVKRMKWRAGMSGTPVAECADDIYAQALLLDLGKALGTRYASFQEEYFYPQDYMRYNWLLKPGAVERMCERLKPLVFVADDEGYKEGLPGVETIVVPVALSAEGESVYAAMKEDSIWGDVVAENAGVQTGKLQQIAAGGLYGEDQVVVWSSDHKRYAVEYLVARIGAPVIIVYNFRFELDMLQGLWPDAPVIGGGASVGAEVIDAFNAGDVPVLLMHWRSGSHGLNLQGACSDLIHLSPCWSADGWTQTIGRIHRRGQTQPCTRYVLTSTGTVESEMLSRVGRKAESEEAFMAALADRLSA